MPKITDIVSQKKNKSRSSVFIDARFYCGLNNETVIKERLKIGQEIELEALAEIQLKSECVSALDKAFGYVAIRPRSRKEMITYLKEKGYLESIIDYCLEKLENYKYIDDESFSETAVRSYSKKSGINKIRQKLYEKGIGREVIENALQAIENQEEVILELSQKYMKNKEPVKKNIDKLYRYLYGKGFKYDDIIKVLEKNYKECREEEFNEQL